MDKYIVFVLLFNIFGCIINAYTAILLLTQKNLVNTNTNLCYVKLPLTKYKFFGIYYLISAGIILKNIYTIVYTNFI